MIEIIQNGETVSISQVRIHRDAISIKFFALIGDEWIRIHKRKDTRLPKAQDVQWPDPGRPFGWSLPYRV